VTVVETTPQTVREPDEQPHNPVAEFDRFFDGVGRSET